MYCYGISIYIVPTFLVAFAIYALIKKYINIKELREYLIACPFLVYCMAEYFVYNG